MTKKTDLQTSESPAGGVPAAPPARIPNPRGRPPKATVPGDSIFAPAMPTSGGDLMAMWDLPPVAYEGGRLKVTRRRYPTNEQELIGESTIAEYSMQDLAALHGPGDFYLQLSADPQKLWTVKHAKVSIAAPYAAAAGFSADYRPPQLPRISEARALSATASALDGSRPLTVADLASLMEMMADKTAAAIRAATPSSTGQNLGMDTGSMMLLWKSMSDMQREAREETMRLVTTMQNGSSPAEPGEAEPPSWIGSAMQALPQVLQMFAKPAPAPGTAPVMAGPAPVIDEDPPVEVPLTAQEAGQFDLAKLMLKPFIPNIIQSLDVSPTVAAVATELLDYIPGRLEPQLIKLDQLVTERGPAVLNILSNQLANPRGADLVHQLVSLLTAEE